MTSKIPQYQARIENVLDNHLNDASPSATLLEAMRYSTLDGGKRIRALLVYASGLAVDADLNALDTVAAAVECIHAYSLIHDDLPAMDNDDLRRGRASSHIQYDEATAILAGDALLTFAFELLNQDDCPLSDSQCRKISHILATSAGSRGMVGGQMLDMIATEKTLTLAMLEATHRHKTGALINAAVLCGALCSSQTTESQLQSFNQYADYLGLAFQVVDDIIDIESSTEILGKISGADQALGKATYPSLLGLDESKKQAETLYQQAVESIATIGDNSGLLAELASMIVNRIH